jgi:hypothetical protein
MMETAPSMVRRRRAFWWVRTLFNPLAKSMLRSPLHGFMSRRLLLITFSRRKSGKQYTTSIRYVQHGDTLLLGVGGQPDPPTVQQALQRGAAVVEITLLRGSRVIDAENRGAAFMEKGAPA